VKATLYCHKLENRQHATGIRPTRQWSGQAIVKFYWCSNVVTPRWWSVYNGRESVGSALGSAATI